MGLAQTITDHTPSQRPSGPLHFGLFPDAWAWHRPENCDCRPLHLLGYLLMCGPVMMYRSDVQTSVYGWLSPDSWVWFEPKLLEDHDAQTSASCCCAAEMWLWHGPGNYRAHASASNRFKLGLVCHLQSCSARFGDSTSCSAHRF